MLCQVCQKNEVSMKITRIVDGTPTEYSVCEDCAPSISPNYAKIQKKQQAKKLSVENLLKDLLAKQAEGAGEGAAPVSDVEDTSCLECGLSFSRYRETYMLGCPSCYDAFGDRLVEDLIKIHGASEHVSDEPAANGASRRAGDMQAQLRVLRRELDECVEAENFDRAAQIRDRIRQLQQQMEERAARKGNGT